MVEVKVLMALAEDNDIVNKEGAKNGEWVWISMRKVHTLLEMEDNDDRKNYLEYLLDESSVYSTLFPPLKMLDGAEPVSRPKNIKSILNLKSTLKAEALKGVIINELSLAPARGNKSTSASKVNLAPADSGCSRNMTGVKSYLHKYVEQLGTKFDEKRGIIFNSNKEVVMIAPRIREVYVLDMTSFVQESCFFAKSYENLNWLCNEVSFIEPYESPKPVVLEIEVSSNQNGQEVDKDAILEFSTIVNFELFNFDVILIFNSFDEGHDSF
nr:hypothetical protein [Tanacetum cinerariifolium]